MFITSGKIEIINGQQRLTTLMLLLRAFYKKFSHMQDQLSLSITFSIKTCIWKTDEFGNSDNNARNIDAKGPSDNDKETF